MLSLHELPIHARVFRERGLETIHGFIDVQGVDREFVRTDTDERAYEA